MKRYKNEEKTKGAETLSFLMGFKGRMMDI